MSNERRFTSIADLEDDFVFAVPEDAKPKDVIEQPDPTKSFEELWKYLRSEWQLKTYSRALQLHPSDKPRDVDARYRMSLSNRLVNYRKPLSIRSKGFSYQTFADIIVKAAHANKDQYILIDVKHHGQAKVNPEYIFKRIKVKIAEEEKQVLFQPSKYLRDPGKIWTLKALAGERLFAKELDANYGVVDGDFIEQLMAKVDMPFYLSADRGYLFGAPLEIHEEEHGKLKKLSAKQALKLLSVPALERVVEQGSAKL